jgi:hypothetical protein
MVKVLNEQLLLEKYLASQFKFGFELEAYAKITDEKFSWYMDDAEVDPDNDEELASYIIEKDIKDAFDYTDNDELDIKSDGSIHITENDEYPFEWATPVMEFTPANLKKCINGLDTLHNYDFYTNDSCGFHVHLSFPDINDQDVIWIISKLSLDNKMIKKITHFKNFDFFNDEYASVEYLKKIGKCIKNSQIQDIIDLMNSTKYRLIRIHPQGTLEWRGPRDFMDDYNKSTVYEFFKLLYELVRWMSNALSDNEINGMTKDNFFKIIYGEHYEPNELISDFNSYSENSIKGRVVKDFKNGDPTFLLNLANKCYRERTKGNNKLLKVVSEYCETLSNIVEKDDYQPFFINLGRKLFDGNHQDEYIQLESDLLQDLKLLYAIFTPLNEEESVVFFKYLLEDDQIDVIARFFGYGDNRSNKGVIQFFNQYQDSLRSFEAFYAPLYSSSLPLKLAPYVHNAKWAEYIISVVLRIYSEKMEDNKNGLGYLDRFVLSVFTANDLMKSTAVKMLKTNRKIPEQQRNQLLTQILQK